MACGELKAEKVCETLLDSVRDTIGEKGACLSHAETLSSECFCSSVGSN